MIEDCQLCHIARVAYETTRAYASTLGDFSRLPWDSVGACHKECALGGVKALLNQPSEEEMHGLWMAAKISEGWTFGPRKDTDLKTHPNLIPYSELPEAEKMRGRLFRAVVVTMLSCDE